MFHRAAEVNGVIQSTSGDTPRLLVLLFRHKATVHRSKEAMANRLRLRAKLLSTTLLSLRELLADTLELVHTSRKAMVLLNPRTWPMLRHNRCRALFQVNQ